MKKCKNNSDICNQDNELQFMKYEIDTNAHVLMHFLKKHMDNRLIHVSPEDRDRWDNKADRSALDNIKQNIINNINNGDINLDGYAKLSDLEDYIRKNSLLGSINGKQFYHNGSITLTALDLGITNISSSNVQYTPNNNLSTSTTGMYRIGTLNIDGTPHELIGVNTAPSNNGAANVSWSYSDNTQGQSNRFKIGTITINGHSEDLYQKDEKGEGVVSEDGVDVSYSPGLSITAETKGVYTIGTITIGGENYELKGVNTGTSSNIVIYDPDDPNMPDPNDPENPGDTIYNVYNTQYIDGKFDDIELDLENLRQINDIYTIATIKEMLQHYNYYKDKYGAGYFEETMIDEKTKAWMKTVGLLKEDGTETAIWSKIKQTYNTLEGDVNLVKQIVYGEDNEGNQWNVDEFLNTKFQAWVNSDGTATGALLNSLAARASVTGEEYERVLQMLIGGFKTYTDFNQAIAQLYADVRNEDGSASTAFVETKAAQNRALIAALADVTTYKILKNESGVPYVTAEDTDGQYDNDKRYPITELDNPNIAYPMHYIYLDEHDDIIYYPLLNQNLWVIDSSKQAGIVTESSLDEAMARIFAEDNQSGAIAQIIAKVKDNKSSLELSADDISLTGDVIIGLLKNPNESPRPDGKTYITGDLITCIGDTNMEANMYGGGFFSREIPEEELQDPNHAYVRPSKYLRIEGDYLATTGKVYAEDGFAIKYNSSDATDHGITLNVTIGNKQLIIKGGIITGVNDV